VITNFPIEIDSIFELSQESTKISPPPRERERDSFSDVFSRVTSERSTSPRPESRDKKEYKGAEEGAVQPLDEIFIVVENFVGERVVSRDTEEEDEEQ